MRLPSMEIEFAVRELIQVLAYLIGRLGPLTRAVGNPAGDAFGVVALALHLLALLVGVTLRLGLAGGAV